MNTNLTIKNFRVFDENGVTIDLAPITILTGCNSSGKSSIVKAVMLLDSFLKQIRDDVENGKPIKLNEYKIDFSTYPNNLLGKFDKVVHSGTSIKKVAIEYTTYSRMLSKDVIVKLTFSAENEDDLNNAYLDCISMYTEDGEFFMSNKEKCKYNFNLIKDDCVDFLLIYFLCICYFGANSEYSIEEHISKDEHAKCCEEFFSELKAFNEKRIKDIINLIYYHGTFDENLEIKENDYDVVNWTKVNKSFFYIPIINKLDNVSKEQFWSFLKEEIINCDDDDINSIASKKIVDDFISSDATSFSEYFKMYEEKFWNQLEISEEDCLNRSISNVYPTIFTPLTIFQQYLFFDPRTLKNIGDTPNNNILEFEIWKNKPINFDMIYEVVMYWNESEKNDIEETKMYYKKNDKAYEFGDYSHRMLKLINSYNEILLQELVTPIWSGNIDYVSSSKVNVNRLYTLESNTDFAQLLRKFLNKKHCNENLNKKQTNSVFRSFFEGLTFSKDQKFEVGSFMNKWIKKFEIGDSVSFHVDNEGLGVQLRLHKSENDEGRLLADEGYGVTQLVYILLQIETAIMSSKKLETHKYMGMGNDEIKKYIDDNNKYETYTIAIELFDAYKNYNIHFIVETHSEYLIRKSQVLVSKMGFSSNQESDSKSPFRTYYVPREGKPYSLGYRKDGKFAESFGPGFYDEAANLTFEIL